MRFVFSEAPPRHVIYIYIYFFLKKRFFEGTRPRYFNPLEFVCFNYLGQLYFWAFWQPLWIWTGNFAYMDHFGRILNQINSNYIYIDRDFLEQII